MWGIFHFEWFLEIDPYLCRSYSMEASHERQPLLSHNLRRTLHIRWPMRRSETKNWNGLSWQFFKESVRGSASYSESSTRPKSGIRMTVDSWKAERFMEDVNPARGSVSRLNLKLSSTALNGVACLDTWWFFNLAFIQHTKCIQTVPKAVFMQFMSSFRHIDNICLFWWISMHKLCIHYFLL